MKSGRKSLLCCECCTTPYFEEVCMNRSPWLDNATSNRNKSTFAAFWQDLAGLHWRSAQACSAANIPWECLTVSAFRYRRVRVTAVCGSRQQSAVTGSTATLCRAVCASHMCFKTGSICCAVGDDEGGTSFLANLHNQQRKLDNLGPSKTGDNKATAVPK